jgi:hypothetical protein
MQKTKIEMEGEGETIHKNTIIKLYTRNNINDN